MSMLTRQGNTRRRFIKLAASAAVGAPACWSSLTHAVLASKAGTHGSAGRVVASNADIGRSMQTGDVSEETFTTHWQGIALGAHTSIALVNQDQEQSRRVLRAAINEIERLERVFSLYRQGSSVVRLNQQGRLEAPSPDLLVLLGQVASINRATDGAFDPTVQSYWQGLASQQTAAVEKGFKVVPTSRAIPGEAVAVLSESANWKHVRYNSSEVAFGRPDMAITLNGIAQGYVTERIANLFREHGYHDVLVDIGEIAALGHREDAQAWKVGIAERQDGAAEESVALTDLSVATSAPLGQIFDARMEVTDTGTGDAKAATADVATGHIINPRTGAPCISPWRRLSVIHRSATVADGLSTGLVMHDKAGIKRALVHYPGARVLAMSAQGEHLDVNSYG